MSQKFQNLVKIISKFPGIGPRQAIRIVLALFNWSGQQIEELAKGILDLKQGLNLCRRCFNFSDDGLCEICQSQKRDQTRITVVEKITDLESMEKTGVFSGVYHVLGGAIDPPEGILPENLKIK
jgi:recombination protein RecR